MIKLTQEIVKEFLDYNPDTGIFVWKHRDRKWFKSKRDMQAWNTRFAATDTSSKPAGYYIMIHVFGRGYQAHRLAWFYINGRWPEDEIDHINHDRTDNRITNLREATRQENQHNRTMSKNNNSGFCGVYWHKKHKKWQSYICVDTKRMTLGRYSNFFDAVCARKSAENKYGFHPNHGMAIKCH